MSFIHGNPSLEGQVCNSIAGSSSLKPRPSGRGVGCSWVLAVMQEAGFGMLDLGCCIWAAGWGVRPRAARSEGASEQPGSWCRAAMRGCWEGVGGPDHPLVSLLPSPSCCACPDSGFTTLAKRKRYRCMSALAPSPILQPSTLASLRWWALQQLARHP